MSGPLHILLIDNDPGCARSLQASIAAVGMRTILLVAADIASALTSIQSLTVEGHPPDLILLGLDLPISILTVKIGELRERIASEKVPIVVLVDRDESSSQAEILRAGAIGVWRRPRNAKAFQVLARLLDHSSDQTPRSRLRTFREFVE